MSFCFMLVREISIENWNEIKEIYINSTNMLRLLTNCRSWALTLPNLCAVYTEYFQNKQLGIIRVGRHWKSKKCSIWEFFEHERS